MATLYNTGYTTLSEIQNLKANSRETALIPPTTDKTLPRPILLIGDASALEVKDYLETSIQDSQNNPKTQYNLTYDFTLKKTLYLLFAIIFLAIALSIEPLLPTDPIFLTTIYKMIMYITTLTWVFVGLIAILKLKATPMPNHDYLYNVIPHTTTLLINNPKLPYKLQYEAAQYLDYSDVMLLNRFQPVTNKQQENAVIYILTMILLKNLTTKNNNHQILIDDYMDKNKETIEYIAIVGDIHAEKYI